MDAEKTVIVPSNEKDEPGFADVLPDWYARDKGMAHYKDLAGAKAEEEHKITGDISISIKIGDKELEI